MKTLIELRDALDSLHSMSDGDKEELFSQIENYGVDLDFEVIRKPGIQCPIMELPLVATCSIEECPFNISNEWHRNCLLDYLDTRGGENLSVEEIAFLYNETPKKVKGVIESGMETLRSKSLQTMGFEGDFKRDKPAEIKANLSEDDEFQINAMTLSPSFMSKTNKAMSALVSDEEVFNHPSIRLLGILESIITEL